MVYSTNSFCINQSFCQMMFWQSVFLVKMVLYIWSFHQSGHFVKLVISSNWTFHQTGHFIKLVISSNWSFRKTCIAKWSFCQNVNISSSHLYKLLWQHAAFCQNCHFIIRSFCQTVISQSVILSNSKCCFGYWSFLIGQTGILPKLSFHHSVILSNCHFINRSFCQTQNVVLADGHFWHFIV